MSKDLRGLIVGEGTMWDRICHSFSLGPLLWFSGCYSDVALHLFFVFFFPFIFISWRLITL